MVAVASIVVRGLVACGTDEAPGGPSLTGPEDAGGQTDSPTLPEVPVDSLTLDPPSATLTVSGSTPKTQAFKAYGQVGGGAPFPVNATFSVDNPGPGSVDASGLYTTNNTVGGVVNVTASYGGKTAKAVLTVVLQVETSSGSIPANPADLFDPTKNQIKTGDAARSPTLVYPVAETKFPQNLFRTLFNWRPAGNKVFLLRFESAALKMRVYTDGVNPVCVQAGTDSACWETVQQTWSYLAASNAGQEVTLTVLGADPASPGTAYASPPYKFSFSKSAVPGAIYYWSTTVKGVRRGTLADVVPTNFMTPAEQNGSCVACHTLSRNGKRLAADVGGENLWVVTVNATTPPPPVFTSLGGKSIPSAWATFNPDATRVVSAKGGVLTLRDGATGAPIGANGGALPLGNNSFGTMPDWAPDGKHVVYAQLTGGGKDRGLTASSIAWLDVSGDVLSNPQVLLASSGKADNHAYPMFNPTSDFIALARGTTDTDNDPTSQIYVARAMPGTTKQPLDRANTLVNDKTVTTGIQNTMPTWAPTSADGVQWVAFTSTRDYGLILANGSTFGSGHDQLWIAAIDRTKLGSGDPSFPAFRVPFLSLTENCHRPFWAEDAVTPPTDGGVGPSPDGGACLGNGADCSTGTCCPSLYCQPSGNTYVCGPPVLK